MSLIQLRNITLRFTGHPLLEKANLILEKGERVCLIGRNGMGKTTLLNLIAGRIQPDSGNVDRAAGLVVSFLPQQVPMDITGTVYEVVASGLGEVGEWLKRYEQLNRQLMGQADEKLLQQLARIQQEIESRQGWQVSQRVEKVLSWMELPAELEFSALSGGMKRRVLLAQALVQEPDLLILDEPTNHLDLAAITWLENFLKDYPATLLFISHDRAFMQALATRIVELDQGQLTSWSGDYASFLVHKESMLAAQETQQALFDKRLAQEEAWIRQGIKARRTRNEGRVRALKKMRAERQARRDRVGSVKFTSSQLPESGQIIFALENVSQVYQDRAILQGLSTTILRGDKIGIIGPNGAGKSTLLKILLGEEAPQQGRALRGSRVEIAYFDQHRELLDENKTVQENVYAGGDMITLDGKTRHVLSYLQDFMFSPQRARSLVKMLSGGERNRLLLARLFTRSANVLILDEPTNDLDVETLELLEEQLMQYTGTLLLVSHDREFLNRVVTSTLVFEGQGRVSEYVGGYEDWLRQRPNPSQASTPVAAPKPAAPVPTPSNKNPSKLSYKEKTELAALPAQIEALEARIQQLQHSMMEPGFYQQSAADIATARQQLAQAEEELATLYARWELLEQKTG